MTIHIMLDLKTWGKRPGCDIRSIGAVVFDPHQDVVCRREGSLLIGENKIEPFYIATDNPIVTYKTERCEETRFYSLRRDPETIKWWNDQPPEAQAAFANPVDLRKALQQFTSWICNLAPVAPPEGFERMRIWANGPQFDVSILAEVYHAVGLPIPWHYRAPRDMRTITDAAGMTHDDYCSYGDAHNALHDAIAQAMTVCEAYKRLGLRK